MAIESLVVLGLATLVLLVFSIYADKHRTDKKDKTDQEKGE